MRQTAYIILTELKMYYLYIQSRKRPHKGGAAPKSGAAVAARLLRRNRPTEAVPAWPSGRNRAGNGQEPGRNRAGTGRRAGIGQEPRRSRAATARPHHSDT